MMGRNTLGSGARKKGNHSAVVIKKAIDLHLSGISLRKAAKDCEVPYPTLRRYVLKHKTDSSVRLVPNYEVNKIFTEDQELSIKDYLVDCANKFYGLSTKDCRKIAYQMATINSISMPSSWQNNEMAGRDWLRGFKRRHSELSIRKPEACSLARATAFNRENVQKFFDNLKTVMNRQPSFGDGRRIYNLDETSTTTVQRPQKVLALKGSNVCKVTSGERGVLVTTCCIVNALGQALPPAMVFPRKNLKTHMLYGAPPGTLGLASPSGWMNADLFVEVIKHFIKHTSASKENPALLLMDNHESHLSLRALDLAKDSGVTVLTLHPHTTAKLQPLDVGLHAPFKTFYNTAVDSWMLRNPGKNLTIYNVAECVGVAYPKSMTPVNIASAFKKCGIFPYDESIFSDIDFLPSSITNRLAPPAQDNEDETDAEEHSIELSNNRAVQRAEDDESGTDAEENIVECVSPSLLENVADIFRPYTPTIISNKNYIESSLNNSDEVEKGLSIPPYSITDGQSQAVKKIKPMSSLNQHLSSFTTPGSSGVKGCVPEQFISPKMFRPPLKAKPRKNTKNRRPGRSFIPTDTPEKKALAERNKRKEINKKAVKRTKQVLFKESKRKKAVQRKSTSSDDEDQVFNCSGSSSGGEHILSESEGDEIVLTDDFPPLIRKPRPKDYVIVIFKSKKINIYYVAQILEEIDQDDCDYHVSYLKLKSKINQKFTEPLEPDTAGVPAKDIKYILPQPIVEGTSRRHPTLKFAVDMSLLNLRY